MVYSHRYTYLTLFRIGGGGGVHKALQFQFQLEIFINPIWKEDVYFIIYEYISSKIIINPIWKKTESRYIFKGA